MATPIRGREDDSMADHTGTQRIHGYCGLCIARCGTVATVEDGRFTRLDPDPSHPTGQAICAKGRAAPELVYHPERLTHPLRRTRPKGDPDPGWERISWDEALDLTAAAMRRVAERHGPQAVAFTVSSPSTTAIGDSTGFIQRLTNAFGTPNADITLDLCGWGRAFATRYTYGVGSVGTGGGGAMPDIAQQRRADPVGLQPQLHPPHPRDRRRRGAEARHAADRRRSAPRRPRQQGRCLAAGAARHRRRARARPRQPDDRARLVRPRLHPRLEQRAAPGARRHRPPADRARPRAGRRCAPPARLGQRGGAAGAVRHRHRPLRRRQRRASRWTANTGSPRRRARWSATRPSSSTRGSAGAIRRRPSRRSAGFRAPRSRKPRG